MIGPTLFTWIAVIFGIVFIVLPVMYAQFLVVLNPQNQKTKDIIIGKNQDYRDKTHLKMTIGLAWADLIFWLPLLLAGSVGVLLGQPWGYILWAASGAISVYVSIKLWFSEREYVYPTAGPLVYYTYLWGFFVYWGIVVVVYSMFRLGCVS